MIRSASIYIFNIQKLFRQLSTIELCNVMCKKKILECFRVLRVTKFWRFCRACHQSVLNGCAQCRSDVWIVSFVCFSLLSPACQTRATFSVLSLDERTTNCRLSRRDSSSVCLLRADISVRACVSTCRFYKSINIRNRRKRKGRNFCLNGWKMIDKVWSIEI